MRAPGLEPGQPFRASGLQARCVYHFRHARTEAVGGARKGGQGARSAPPGSPPGDGGKPSKEDTLTPPPSGAFPLPVLMDDGSFLVVSIPQMSEAAFKLFKEHLEAYKNGFVRRPVDKTSSDESDDG